MNLHYPYWHTAHIIIPNLVDKYFGVFAYHDMDRPEDVSVRFLDDDHIYMVPPEDQSAFLERYTAFITWLDAQIDVAAIIKRFHWQPCTQSMFEEMRNSFFEAFSFWESQNNYSMKQCMKNILLGFEPISAITGINISVDF